MVSGRVVEIGPLDGSLDNGTASLDVHKGSPSTSGVGWVMSEEISGG